MSQETRLAPSSCYRPGCADNCGGNRRDDSVGVVVASPQNALACRLLDPYQESFVRRSKIESLLVPLGLPVGTLAMCFTCAATAAPVPSPDDTTSTTDANNDGLTEVTVTADRLSLLGKATTASEGIVVNEELALTPAYRVGQLLETVPGLQVTSHSGEGKANQYLMRGYNLDHGTDLATFIDGMPVNEPTHAHGQGYTDLNFLIPELATNITYTKGTYYADEGDFASVGSVHINYLNRLEPQASFTAGTFGYERAFAGDSIDGVEAPSLGRSRWRTMMVPG